MSLLGISSQGDLYEPLIGWCAVTAVTITGLSEVRAQLRALPGQIQRHVLDGAAHDGAEALKALVKANIRRRSGRLVASVILRRSRSGWVIEATAPYASFVEWGHGPPRYTRRTRGYGRGRGRRGRISGRRTPAQRFMRKALANHQAYLAQVIASGISRRLASMHL